MIAQLTPLKQQAVEVMAQSMWRHLYASHISRPIPFVRQLATLFIGHIEASNGRPWEEIVRAAEEAERERCLFPFCLHPRAAHIVQAPEGTFCTQCDGWPNDEQRAQWNFGPNPLCAHVFEPTPFDLPAFSIAFVLEGIAKGERESCGRCGEERTVRWFTDHPQTDPPIIVPALRLDGEAA